MIIPFVVVMRIAWDLVILQNHMREPCLSQKIYFTNFWIV